MVEFRVVVFSYEYFVFEGIFVVFRDIFGC